MTMQAACSGAQVSIARLFKLVLDCQFLIAPG